MHPLGELLPVVHSWREFMSRNRSNLGRRQFLTTSSAALASPVLAKATGLLDSESISQSGAMELAQAKPGHEASSKSVDTMSADLIVIGGGGSGLAAAVSAAMQGVKKVVVLETLNAAGGNSQFPEGIFGAESKVLQQKGTGMTSTKDAAFKTLMQGGRYRLNAPLVRALVDGSGDTVDWLAEQGVDFGLMPPMPGRRGGAPAAASGGDGTPAGGPPGEEMPTSAPPISQAPQTEAASKSSSAENVRIGGVIVQVLIKRCKELGVQILPRTRAKQILKEGGRVTGVLAEQSKGDPKISAKSVIVATGGFSGNTEMMSKYLPPFQKGDNVFIGGIAHRGDGIRMAEEIGAGIEPRGATEFAMDRFMVPGGPGPESIYLIFVTMKQSVLSINKKGERIPDNTNNIWRQPGKLAYLVFDEKMKQEFYKTEVGETDRKLFGTSPWWKGGNLPKKINELTHVWENVEKDLQAFAKKGRGVKITNSWDEMAKWMGVSPAVLKATIDEYNAGCDSGIDLFGRDKRSLSPLRTPPYYAITTGLTLLVTHGVIKTSKKMQVLDTKEDPIPGLYVAGDDIGGVDEDVYGGLGGHSQGFALTSGRLAGQNAAAYIIKG
jgi:fumarate reductase flavoprotein subunit